MTGNPWDWWEVAQTVADRNGLEPLTVFIHATDHHDGRPAGSNPEGWGDICERVAGCLLGQFADPSGVTP
jgi:hypothetical protein